MSFSGVICSRLMPRFAGTILILAGLLALPGCWVTSINGLNDEGFFRADKDRAFDARLIGFWGMTIEKCSTILRVKGKDNLYEWDWTGLTEECSDKGKTVFYEARLFKLDDHQFLDLTARSEDVCDMCKAVHWIFLADIDKDSFILTPIDSEWLKKAEEEKTVTLPTVPGDTDTLTASPKELKAFCVKYANDKDVFKPMPGFTFKRQ